MSNIHQISAANPAPTTAQPPSAALRVLAICVFMACLGLAGTLAFAPSFGVFPALVCLLVGLLALTAAYGASGVHGLMPRLRTHAWALR